MIRQAVIIAGGLGTRAHEMTGDLIPKALLPLDGVPIIIRQMRSLAGEGITKISVLGGHLGGQLAPILQPEANMLGMELNVLIEASPLGTAGCLTTMGAVSEETLIVYGDMLFDIDLSIVARYRASYPAILTIICHPNDHPRTSDLVVERNGYVKKLLPKKMPREGDFRNLVPAGLYVAAPEFFVLLPPGETADMINDVIPQMLKSGIDVGVYNTPEYIRDTGSPVRHNLAEEDLRLGRVQASHLAVKRPTVFFDCDGVLNRDVGGHGIVNPDQIELIEGAADAVRIVRESGLLTVAVTNRPQVAKGFIDFDGLDKILGRLETQLAEKKGVLDKIFACPHHPDQGFMGEISELKIECDCRKPKDGLIRQAAGDLPIDLSRSSIIGDSLVDIGAGRAAGIRAYGVRTGYGLKDSKHYTTKNESPPVADFVFDHVLDAAKFQCSYLELANEVLASCGFVFNNGEPAPQILTVSGRSRAGKSFVAHAIERFGREQGFNIFLVQLARLFMTDAEKTVGMGVEERFPLTDYLGIIGALKNKHSFVVSGEDDNTSSALSATEIIDLGNADLIVVEGAFVEPQYKWGEFGRSVHVECDDAIVKERLTRFYRWKGTPEKEICQLIDEHVSEEWPRVDRQRATADLIINPKDFIL